MILPNVLTIYSINFLLPPRGILMANFTFWIQDGLKLSPYDVLLLDLKAGTLISLLP